MDPLVLAGRDHDDYVHRDHGLGASVTDLARTYSMPADLDPEERQRRANVHRLYKSKFGGMPFFLVAMDDAARSVAFDLMEAAINDGEPVSDRDVERLNPPNDPNKLIL